MTRISEAVDVVVQRQRLEAMQASLRDRHQRLKLHISNRDEPLPADFSEQAVELENDEAMVAIDQELTEELGRVEQALARIEAGTYGLCGRCGESILAERLDALPAAGHCLHCVEAKN